MSFRTTENRILERKGYNKGEKKTEATNCEICRKRISGTAVWWKHHNPSEQEPVPYCRPCLMFKVFVQSN